MGEFEYRVVWKRDGCIQKSKIYQTLGGAEEWLLVLGPQPWLSKIATKHDPDSYYCCPGTSGFECGCGGVTTREHWLDRREGLAPLAFARMEQRSTTDWRLRVEHGRLREAGDG